MSLRNRFVLMVVVAALAVLSGCSSTHKATPPPTGGFSDTDLNGTYVFSTSGSDSANGDFLTMVGTFTACGCTGGTISSGGIMDMNDSGFSGPASQLAITGGTYHVGLDGRGTAQLTVTTPFASSVTLDFVLSSTQHGLVTEFDNNGSGSGTLDLQTTVAQSAIVGTWVFNLAGTSSLSLPEATVGSFALDTSGNATGVQDLNSNAVYSALAISSPSAVSVGTSPGTATIGASHFDVYAIDSTHMKFIEIDTPPAPVLVGDVFSQTTPAFPTGELAFTMAGLDYAAGSPPPPLAVGGMMNITGTSISAGVEDVNDAGASNITQTSSAPLTFSGSVASSGGRYFVTLNNFENGNNANVGTFMFAAYPSTGGTQLVEVDGLGVTSGAAYPQTATSFASGQGYGLNLTAIGNNGIQSFEEDDIAEFTNTSNNLTGLIDVNDEGATNPPQNFSGTYSADTSNPGRAIISSSAFNLASYTLNGTTTIFIEFDQQQVGSGSIGQQAAQSQGAIATRMAAFRPKGTAARGAWKRPPAIVRSR